MNFWKKTLFAFACGSVLSVTSFTLAAEKPVFGYMTKTNACALTLDGQPKLRLEQIPADLQPRLAEDLETLARGLNRSSQTPNFKPGDIQPALVNGRYEMRYREQVLLRLSSAWSAYGHQSQLSALLDLTNQIRTSLQASPLRSYAFLSSSKATQIGMASWYGGAFHGRRTANGERYNIREFTAAHKALPFGTRVLVTNLDSKQSVVVKINDRGPFNQRIIDLSPAAFNSIGSIGQGVMRVKLTVLG